MAKGKKSSGKTYVSKGQRPNVSRSTRNAARRARRENRPIEDILKANAHRQRVIDKPLGESEKKLRLKYLEEERVAKAAAPLMNQFGHYGMAWGAAVMAVKTNKVSEVSNMWAKRRQTIQEAQKLAKLQGKRAS